MINRYHVKQWLGHSTLEQMVYYAHVGLAEMENATAKLWGEWAKMGLKMGKCSCLVFRIFRGSQQTPL